MQICNAFCARSARSHLVLWADLTLAYYALLCIAALAKSKFRGIPWVAQHRAGHIVLQDHGDEAFFRGIRVRELR